MLIGSLPGRSPSRTIFEPKEVAFFFEPVIMVAPKFLSVSQHSDVYPFNLGVLPQTFECGRHREVRFNDGGRPLVLLGCYLCEARKRTRTVKSAWSNCSSFKLVFNLHRHVDPDKGTRKSKGSCGKKRSSAIGSLVELHSRWRAE